jgi:L-alanine-DL-glutamate epimerase-like enolase superfamily enzyme
MCEAALAPDRLAALVGADPRRLGALCEAVREELDATPAALAAVDMALYDLFGRWAEVPVVDLLGRRGPTRLTSITLGIRSTEETLQEAREYVGRGFKCLKVKLGISFEQDVDRLRRLREQVGPSIRIRGDANEGYDADQARRLEPLLDELDLEFVEQPLPAAALEEIRALPEALRRRLALDESVHDDRDAAALLQPPAACGTFVIKLMKAGGITPARKIAGIAEAGACRVMWGCMDESVISIAAALHAAYASPATRYLDLDGSFDLERDPARGGFSVIDGRLEIEADAGLGVQLDR